MSRHHLPRRRALGLALAAALLGGCASQSYDPVPGDDRQVQTLAVDSSLDVEAAYRLLNARLQACVGIPYHVQPRFERDTGRAWVMVVSGLGLDRYSFLGNRFEARYQVDASPTGSRVVVTYAGDDMARLARAARGWLQRGTSGCVG